jgi:hypothetical protein
MAGFTITTQDSLLAHEGDEPYILLVNQTDYDNCHHRFGGLLLPAHLRVLRPVGPYLVE